MRGPEYCKINRPCFKQTFVVFFADTIAYAGYLHQYLNMTLLHVIMGVWPGTLMSSGLLSVAGHWLVSSCLMSCLS